MSQELPVERNEAKDDEEQPEKTDRRANKVQLPTVSFAMFEQRFLWRIRTMMNQLHKMHAKQAQVNETNNRAIAVISHRIFFKNIIHGWKWMDFLNHQ